MVALKKWRLQQCVWAALLVACVGWGCAWSEDHGGREPPAQSFYYPVSMQSVDDGKFVYVVNSNFDQYYNSGWISVIDMQKLKTQIDASDDNTYDSIKQQLKVLSLGGQLALSPEPTQEVGLLAHRGRSTVTVLRTHAAGGISCGDATGEHRSGAEQRTDCAKENMVHFSNDYDPSGQSLASQMGLPEGTGVLRDPYGVTLFHFQEDSSEPQSQLVAAVGFLNSPDIALLKVDSTPHVTQLSAMQNGAVNLGSGAVGVLQYVHVAQEDGSEHPFVIAASQYHGANRVRGQLWQLDVAKIVTEGGTAGVSVVPVDQQMGAVSVSDFLPLLDNAPLLKAGDFAVSVNAYPNAVALYEFQPRERQLWSDVGAVISNPTSLQPALKPVGVWPLAGEPMTAVRVRYTDGKRGFAVATLDDNSIYFFRREGQRLVVVARIEGALREAGVSSYEGEGPFAMHFVGTTLAGEPIQWLLVANFLDHSVTVIDVKTFKVITRIHHAVVPKS